MDTKYSISARTKPSDFSIENFLRQYFPLIKYCSIDSIFGFVEFCSLYGGRPFSNVEISQSDLDFMYHNNINLKLPLTNHYIDYVEYKKHKIFLNKYHKVGNSVVVFNDTLANWIKQDYPLYRVEASAIKNIDSIDKIDIARKTYDKIVLPSRLNNEKSLLTDIKEKNNIILFGTAGCVFNCLSPTCYERFSRQIKGESLESYCSKNDILRGKIKFVTFDIRFFESLGFSNFKLIHYN